MGYVIAFIIIISLLVVFCSMMDQAEKNRHEYIKKYGLEAYKRKMNGHRYIKGRKCPACGKETLMVMTKKEVGQKYMPKYMRDKIVCDHCNRRW